MHFELIIVNDGSTDNSHALIEQAIKNKQNITYHKHETNLGIGSALKAGYRMASNENVCAVPGDCQFNFNELLECPTFTSQSFVSFYRRRTRYNPYRWFLNVFNRLINYLFLGLQMNDVNWVKVYKKEHLANMDFEMTSSLIESEICAKLGVQGIQCIEMESEYLERQNDESKGGALKTVSQAAKDLFKLIRVVKTYKKEIHG